MFKNLENGRIASIVFERWEGNIDLWGLPIHQRLDTEKEYQRYDFELKVVLDQFVKFACKTDFEGDFRCFPHTRGGENDPKFSNFHQMLNFSLNLRKITEQNKSNMVRMVPSGIEPR